MDNAGSNERMKVVVEGSYRLVLEHWAAFTGVVYFLANLGAYILAQSIFRFYHVEPFDYLSAADLAIFALRRPSCIVVSGLTVLSLVVAKVAISRAREGHNFALAAERDGYSQLAVECRTIGRSIRNSGVGISGVMLLVAASVVFVERANSHPLVCDWQVKLDPPNSFDETMSVCTLGRLGSYLVLLVPHEVVIVPAESVVSMRRAWSPENYEKLLIEQSKIERRLGSGVRPVLFAKRHGWNFDQTRALSPSPVPDFLMGYDSGTQDNDGGL
jgi:hypothetical protein